MAVESPKISERAQGVKRHGWQFLTAVETRLATDLRESVAAKGAIAAQVEEIVRTAKARSDQSHLKLPEAAFLNTWVPPAIHAAMARWGIADPGSAFLAESHKGLKAYAVGTPARKARFPFGKEMGVPAGEIYERWVRGAKEAFKQPCPDFAVRQPAPIVFEGKYFRSGGEEYAKRQLVAAIHESLFYLGVPADPTAGREWDYRYACLIAYDASNDQQFFRAWQRIAGLKKKFWDEANLFVMVLGSD